jgi:GTP cyclohydrolase I
MFNLFIIIFYFLLLTTVNSIKIENSIAKSIKNIIKDVGEDPEREGLVNTPDRFSKAITFLTSGYTKNVSEVIGTGIFNENTTDDIVIVKDIEMYSLCEHHLLPFFGKVHIGYIPNGKILGLSKFAKIVELYSRRFQVQERLTKEIAEAVMSATNAKGVIVGVEACHLCMMMRGVQKQNSVMTTSVMTGAFRKEISTRSEFLNLINR